jgi:hypothetical protein
MEDASRDVPPKDVLESRELVTVRVFVNISEALFAKGSLESAGIECFLVDDNMVRLDWFMVNVIGGIKLKVAAEDVEAALALLNRPMLVYSDDEDESDS